MSEYQEKLQHIRQATDDGQFAEAERQARTLLEMLPSAAETVFLLAHAVHRQDRLEEAAELYDLALRYVPTHASALNNSASVLRRLGRTSEALERYRQATVADPEKSWIWSNYAQALEDEGHAAPALEAIKRAVELAPDDVPLKERLIALTMLQDRETDNGSAADATDHMWSLNPAVADFERLGLSLRPYVGRTAAPNYRSNSLTTDRHGFRRVNSPDGLIGYDAFTAASGPKGVICGASQAFGYGLADEMTVASQLSVRRAGGGMWHSFAAPISHVMQQRLLFELFAPPETRYCVVMSGTVNVLLALLAEGGRHPYPPIHNLSFNWPDSDERKPDIDMAFQQSIQWMRDNIAMFAAKCAQLEECHLLFCHPPVLAWTEKPVTSSEEELLALYKARHASYAELIEAPANRSRWERYRAVVRSAVQSAGGTYLEASEEPAFASPEALFCDALHPNEAGARILANSIARWADEVS